MIDLLNNQPPELGQTLQDCLSLSQELSERLSSRLDRGDRICFLRLHLRLAALALTHSQDLERCRYLDSMRRGYQLQLQAYARDPSLDRV